MISLDRPFGLLLDSFDKLQRAIKLVEQFTFQKSSIIFLASLGFKESLDCQAAISSKKGKAFDELIKVQRQKVYDENEETIFRPIITVFC